jgi:DNA/RNA endonuclease G (NUC1)
MKKLLILLLLTISATVFGQNTLLVDKKIYTVVYSQQLRNPLTVAYKLYKPKSNVKRTGSFYKEKGIQTAGEDDYKDNVYDKGHMAAAETFSDTEQHMHLTFSYLNCAVQHYQLNRGVWKSLEEHERQWAQQDSLFVTNRVIFNQPFHPMKSGAFIPDYFEKEIRFMSTGIVRLYRFPNVKPVSDDIDYYLVKK